VVTGTEPFVVKDGVTAGQAATIVLDAPRHVGVVVLSNAFAGENESTAGWRRRSSRLGATFGPTGVPDRLMPIVSRQRTSNTKAV
jgi:hypothetical protein